MLPGSMQKHAGSRKHVEEDEKPSSMGGGGGWWLIASRNTMKVLKLSVKLCPVGPECSPHLMLHLLLALVRKVMKFY
jgi:hypothetical protein